MTRRSEFLAKRALNLYQIDDFFSRSRILSSINLRQNIATFRGHSCLAWGLLLGTGTLPASDEEENDVL
jgi:hypothetical protein